MGVVLPAIYFECAASTFADISELEIYFGEPMTYPVGWHGGDAWLSLEGERS